jgi:hypothetical protein
VVELFEDPAGGAGCEPELVPMLGQFFALSEVDPFELDGDGVLVELLPVAAVLVLVLGVLLDAVVAALAAKAPPATRPLVSAPVATTLRRRIFISFSFGGGVAMRRTRRGTETIVGTRSVHRSRER